MFAPTQTLHPGLTSTEVQELLDKGARVVYAHRFDRDSGLWDVILESFVPDEHPEAIVLDFLAHVDTGTLEAKMLEGADMGTGVGKSAIKALVDMVRPSAP